MDIVPDLVSGLILPEPAEVWAVETTVGEAGPKPAPPTPQEDALGRLPGLPLAATGELAPGAQVAVQLQHGGPTGTAAGLWRRTIVSGSTVSQNWRGCDVPNTLVQHYPGLWTGSAVAVTHHPSRVVLTSGTHIVAYAYKSSTAATTWSIRTVTWSSTTGSYSAASTVVDTLTLDPWPALWQVTSPERPDLDGLLLLAFWVSAGTNRAQVRIYASRDSGTSWSQFGPDALPEAIDLTTYTQKRLQVAFAQGVFSLIAQVDEDGSSDRLPTLWQWASGDGSRWSLVADTLTVTDYGYGEPSVCLVDGRLAVAFFAAPSGTPQSLFVYCAFLGSPWQPVVEASRWTVANDTAGQGATPVDFGDEYALCATRVPDGRVGVVFATAGSIEVWSQVAIVDLRVTPYTIPGGTQYTCDGILTEAVFVMRLHDASLVWHLGQLHLTTRIIGVSAVNWEDIWSHFALGGFATLTLPSAGSVATELEQLGQTMSFPAVDVPSALGFTTSGTGTVSVTTHPGQFTITCSAATLYHEHTTGYATSTAEYVEDIEFSISSGTGSVAADALILRLRISDGATYGYDCSLRVSTSQVALRDNNAASTLATVAGGSAVVLRLAMTGTGTVRAWWRSVSATSADRQWTVIGASTTLTDDAGAGGAGLRRWGTVASTTITYTARLPRSYVGTAGPRLSASTAPGTSNLWPLRIDRVPDRWTSLLALHVGLGVGLPGDAWLIDGDASSPARAALPRGLDASDERVRGGTLPSPSDAAAWTSTATTGTLAFRPVGGGSFVWQRGALGIHFERPNFGSVEIRTTTSTSSPALWTTLVTLDLRSATALPFLRSGARLYIYTGGTFTDEPIWRPHELAGGYAILPSGKVRPIRTNSGGQWSTDGVHPKPWIDLDPDSLDTTEAGTGTLDILPPRVTVVLPTSGTICTGFGLRWGSAPPTYSGLISLGILAFGDALLQPSLADKGEVYGASFGATVEDFATGARVVWTEREARRIARISYAVPASRPGTQSVRSYRLATSAPVFATESEVSGWRGIVEAAGGALEPVVFLPAVESGSSTQYLSGPNEGIYGRIVGEEIEEVIAIRTAEDGIAYASPGTLEIEAEL